MIRLLFIIFFDFLIIMNRKFKLNVSCKEFIIDQYKNKPIHEQLDIFINLYRGHITLNELNDLKNKKKYIRFLLFQDNQDTDAYMYAYCRDINLMSNNHKEKIDNLNINILGEINYSTIGCFFNVTNDWTITLV